MPRARLTGPLPVVNFMDLERKEIDISHIVSAALAIAAKRREVLLRLREALQANDVAKAITLAKELCGLNEQERH